MATQQSEGHPKPDEKILREAGELEILDESGKAITFNQLYNTENRQVIVFIRHFFCGENTTCHNALGMLLLLSLKPNASEGRRLSQVGLVSSVSLCTWNELVRL